MQQEHVEILLEQIAGNTQLTLEGLDIVNSRLGRLEAGHDRTEARLEIIEGGLAGLKAGQDDLRAGQEKLKADVGDLKADVRDIKCSVGLLGSVAGDHETRLQTLESTLRDHVTNHS